MPKEWKAGRSRSAWVKVATTPGRRCASLTSIPVTRAWAWGERTKATWSSPGTARLPMNVPRPSRSSGSSTLTTSVPSSDPGMPATLRLEVRPPTWRPVCTSGSAGRPVRPRPARPRSSRQAPRSMSGLRSWIRFTASSSSRSASSSSGGPSATTRWSSENTTQRSASSSSVGEVVGGEHDRLARAVELDDQLDEPLLRARVERGGRLVEQQHLGVHHQHRGDGDPLLLAAGQLVRRAVGQVGDVEHRQRVVDPLPRPRPAPGPVAADRRRAPRGPSARTPGRRSSGR